MHGVTNPFWEYSCSAYGREGVASLCLELQDRLDVDVNVLLYAAWLGFLGRSLSQEHLQGVDEQVRQWREDIVRPLRALRRDLKALGAGSQTYEDVKKLELAAEEQQQQLMYAYFEAHPVPDALGTSGASLMANLQLVARLSTADTEDWNDKLQLLSQYLAV